MSTGIESGSLAARRPLAGDEVIDRDEGIAARRWVPGEPGIWALIFTDLGIFTVYFIDIMYESGRHEDVFAAGHESLSLSIGILNTFSC